MHGTACTLIEGTAEGRIAFLKLAYNTCAAAVCPRLHIREGLFLRIHRDQAVHDCAQCDPGYSAALITQGIRCLTDNLLRRSTDLGGSLLRPVRMWRTQRIKRLCRCTTHAGCLVCDRAHACRPDIHADPNMLFLDGLTHTAPAFLEKEDPIQPSFIDILSQEKEKSNHIIIFYSINDICLSFGRIKNTAQSTVSVRYVHVSIIQLLSFSSRERSTSSTGSSAGASGSGGSGTGCGAWSTISRWR